MKKSIILAVLMLAAVTAPSVNAQFRYGPMVGVSITNLKFKQDLISIEKTTGFSAGAVAEMMFPGIGFGIDLGFYYEMRGAKLAMGEKTIWSSQGYGNERMSLHYLTIPLHLRFKYTRMNGFEEKLAPIVYVGPTFGFHLGNSKNNAMDYAGGDLGIEFGGGVELFRHWQVTASYNLGMTYVTKAKILTNYSARSRCLNFRVSYLF